MNAVTNFARAQANYDAMLPPEDGLEPSEAHAEEAFAQLVQDSELLAEFIENERPDYTTVFQLFHAHGLPLMNKTARDDKLREKYDTTMQHFFDHYRDWLGDRLTAKADEVMQAQIAESRAEAAEYAAESRRESRGW